MKRSAFAITLVLILAGGVLAQSRSVKTGPATAFSGEFGFSVPKIEGIEATKGTDDPVDSICWGRTFTMMNDNVSFNIAPDYYMIRVFDGVEDVDKVLGGSWTLINRNSKMNGMLFGVITGGSIEWYYGKDGTPAYGEINVTVNISGGTDGFSNVGGAKTFGTFTGTVNYSPSGVPVIQGSLELVF